MFDYQEPLWSVGLGVTPTAANASPIDKVLHGILFTFPFAPSRKANIISLIKARRDAGRNRLQNGSVPFQGFSCDRRELRMYFCNCFYSHFISFFVDCQNPWQLL